MTTGNWDLHSDVEQLKRLVLNLPDSGPPAQILTAIDEAHAVLAGVRSAVVAEQLQEPIAELRPSPAVAAAVALSQGLLDQLDEHAETRLLSAAGMAAYVRRSRNWPAESARAGRLISVHHAGKVLYPAFQVDPDTRTVRPWVTDMVAFLDDFGAEGRDFAVWAAAPSGRFGGEPPALHAGDADFLAKAISDVAGP